MAGGGNLLIDALVTLACFAGGGSFLILIDQYRKEAKDNGAWGVFGDVVELPDAAKIAGGGAQRSAGHVRTDDIAHRGRAPTR